MLGDPKNDEVFYRLTQQDNFQDDVKSCRKDFDIPENGLPEEKIVQWEKSFKPIKYAEFLLRVDEIWNSYKLSYIFLPRLEQYVITNKIEIPYQYPFSPFCEIGTGGFT